MLFDNGIDLRDAPTAAVRSVRSGLLGSWQHPTKLLEQPAKASQVSRRSQPDVICSVCDSDERIHSGGGLQCGLQSSESLPEHGVVAITAIDHLRQRVQALCVTATLLSLRRRFTPRWVR